MKYLVLFTFLLFYIEMFCQQDLGCNGRHFHHFIDSVLKISDQNYIRYKGGNVQNRSMVTPTFIWPLRPSAAYQDLPGYFAIWNYVDLDQTSGTLDYNCGSRTYNGHRGHDIVSFPFMWHMTNKDYVEVIAAADGLVTKVTDNNNNDNNCLGGGSSNTNNNVVIITHDDGSRTIYYHIKSNSATVVENQYVKAGDKIALVASSGFSNGPHLHFEVRDPNNDVIEPNIGSCNSTTSTSWFINQRPYWVAGVNRISCHSTVPACVGDNSTGWCDNEVLNFKNDFNQGEILNIAVAFSDILNGASVDLKVFNPAGVLIYNPTYTHNQSNTQALLKVFTTTLSPTAPSGTYKIRVLMGAKEYFNYFTVNCVSNLVLVSDYAGDFGFNVGNSLTSSSKLLPSGNPPLYQNTSLRLQAGTQVKLLPDFHASAGTLFSSKIRGCNYSH